MAHAFESLALCGYKGQQFHARTEEGRMPLSKKTIFRRLSVDYLSPLTEVGFTAQRFLDARQFYTRCFPVHLKFFTLSNDMTAVTREITPRRSDLALLGGATLKALYVPDSLTGIVELINKYGLANNIDVLLLNPSDASIPSFVLAIFPRDGRATASIIRQMWSVATDILDKLGLFVTSCGADGDSAHISAQKSLCGKGLADTNIPAIVNEFREVPRSKLFEFVIRGLDDEEETLRTTCRNGFVPDSTGALHAMWIIEGYFQDWGHVLSKLRNRLAGRNWHGVRLGNSRADVLWIKNLLEANAPELAPTTGLLYDDLDPKKDPMNVKAGMRITSPQMFDFLLRCQSSKIPGANRHLSLYLKLMHHSVRAFSDANLSLATRVRMLSWSRFFVQGWQRDAIKHRDKETEFITQNQFDCICINAEQFILQCRWMISAPHIDLMRSYKFSPQRLGEPENEFIFRNWRSLYNDRNFCVAGAINRSNHVQMHDIITATFPDQFVYAQHRKHMDSLHRPAESLPQYSSADLRQWVEEARQEAIKDLDSVSIKWRRTVEPVPAAVSAGARAALAEPRAPASAPASAPAPPSPIPPAIIPHVGELADNDLQAAILLSSADRTNEQRFIAEQRLITRARQHGLILFDVPRMSLFFLFLRLPNRY